MLTVQANSAPYTKGNFTQTNLLIIYLKIFDISLCSLKVAVIAEVERSYGQLIYCHGSRLNNNTNT